MLVTLSSAQNKFHWKKYLRWAAFSLFFAALAMFLLSLFYLNDQFTRHISSETGVQPPSDRYARTISFLSDDNIQLKAWMFSSKLIPPKGVVILLHDLFHSDASDLLGYADFLSESGYTAITLDMRAHGRSGGKRIGLTIEEPKDVQAVVDWIKEQPGLRDQPLALFGLRYGGAVALRSAAEQPEIKAVISVNSFASLPLFLRSNSNSMHIIPKPIQAVFTPFFHLSIFSLYGQWPARASPIRYIKKIPQRPVLLIHDRKKELSPTHAVLLDKAAQGNAVIWLDDNIMMTSLYKERIIHFLNENL
jgi:hypothetical protein